MTEATDGAPPLTRRERRMRRWLVALAVLLALAVMAVAGVVFYWRLYLLGPSGDPFTRGPYLVRVTGTTAELRWTVTGGRAVEVVARDPAGRVTTARGGVLTGLAPGTRYAWAANVGGRARAAGTFATPSPDPARPVRFAVFGDYGDGSDDEWAVMRTVAAGDPQFVVTAGDNSYLTAASILLDRNVFRPLAEVLRHAPVYVGIGDHDTLPPGDGALRAAFGIPAGDRYVVAQGPIQIVHIGVTTGDGAVAFARRALARPGFTRRFVVVHRPVKPGDPILPVLRAARVDAVFAGHLHLYERRVVGGVRTFTVGSGGTGAGGAEFTPRSPDAQVSLPDFGHLQVDVGPRRVVYTFVDARGRVLDRTGAP